MVWQIRISDVEEHISRAFSQSLFQLGCIGVSTRKAQLRSPGCARSCIPRRLVVLGGLTATVFHEEILRKYVFIDAVIRGEAEKPFSAAGESVWMTIRALETVPNLTFRRRAAGGIVVVPLMKPDEDLDEYEFTRLDLLEPKNSIFAPGICRAGSSRSAAAACTTVFHAAARPTATGPILGGKTRLSEARKKSPRI